MHAQGSVKGPGVGGKGNLCAEAQHGGGAATVEVSVTLGSSRYLTVAHRVAVTSHST